MSALPRAADYFGERVVAYDRRYDRRDADGHALRARMNAVLREVGQGPGAVVDAGMGAGRLCRELAARGWTVSGVDASPEMVDAARERLPEARERLICAVIEELPFADASFDAVTATGVLEYSDVPRALAELARVLRPGGCAVVSYPNPYAAYGIWKTRVWYPVARAVRRALHRPHSHLPRGADTLPPKAFSAALGSAGFDLRRFDYTSFLLVPTPLERLAPAFVVWLGERFEGRGDRLGRVLATQIVYSALKTKREQA